MKTFAHINQAGDVVAIGMIYFESGEMTPEVEFNVKKLGEEDGLIVYGDKVKPDAALTTVVIDTDELPGGIGMQFDATFRNAFKYGGGYRVDVDVPKAKEITHERRRFKRAAEFAPLDIEATIPAMAQAAETKRQAVRDKYSAMQAQIDACTTPEALKSIISANDL